MDTVSEKNKKWKKFKDQKMLFLLLIIPIVLTFIFKYIPMYGILLAFKDYNPLVGIWNSKWVGFTYFQQFVNSPNFWTIFINTLKLSVYGTVLGFFPPIILALMFNQLISQSAKRRVQLIMYLPNFISVVILVGMVMLFFSADGPVTHILQMMGFNPPEFLTSPGAFRPLYIVSGIWQGMGWASILYTSTLAGVSPELYEAASIDGASIWEKIIHIDLPALKPVMLINFILAVGGIMSVGYEKAYLMQTSLNLPTSEIIATYVYKVGLQNADYSYSTAIGLFNTVINLILIIAANETVKKLNNGKGLY